MKPEAFHKIQNKIGETIYLILTGGNKFKATLHSINMDSETIKVNTVIVDMNSIAAYGFYGEED